MRELSLLFSNYAIFTAVACALAGVQSSLWLQVFGFSPAPYLFLIVITYWTLYRSMVEGLIITYIVTFAMVSMSGIPLQTSFAVTLSVYGIIYLLRDRVLWGGVNSFMLASGMAAALLPLFNFLWSQALEDRPISDFHFFEWIVRALLTAMFAIPLYALFAWFDRLTHKEAPKDTESSLL